MEYKVDFIIGLFSYVSLQILGVIFIWVIFLEINNLNGWSFYQIVFIYGLATTVQSLWEFFFDGITSLNEYVMSGKLDFMLTKPVSPLFQLLTSRLEPYSLGQLLVGIILIVRAVNELNIRLDIFSFFLLVIAITSGLLIYLSISLVAACIVFWFYDPHGLVGPILELGFFANYPINIFSIPIQIFLTFVLPFGFASFYPATFFLGKKEFILFSLSTPAVAVLSFILAHTLWKIGLKRYESTGT